ncbi:MAG: tetratricopeptide repeat protein, partial [Gaiellaceae bacterium]
AGERDYARAADEARRAERLEPWSVEPLLLLGRARARSGDRVAAAATFRRAARRDPGNWRSWYELAAVSRGAERAAALRRARELNPRESLLDALEPGS